MVKRKIVKTNMVLWILVMIALIISIYSLTSKEIGLEIPNMLALPELSTVGYIEVTPEASVIEGRGVVILTSECYQVTATTEAAQAESIVMGLAGKIDVRPNAHDLMRDAFKNLGIEVVMVKVVDIRNDTFIGRMILKQGNKILSLDSRPSDGTAIAVRTGAPIYFKESLLKEYGRYIC